MAKTLGTDTTAAKTLTAEKPSTDTAAVGEGAPSAAASEVIATGDATVVAGAVVAPHAKLSVVEAQARYDFAQGGLKNAAAGTPDGNKLPKVTKKQAAADEKAFPESPETPADQLRDERTES